MKPARAVPTALPVCGKNENEFSTVFGNKLRACSHISVLSLTRWAHGGWVLCRAEDLVGKNLRMIQYIPSIGSHQGITVHAKSTLS